MKGKLSKSEVEQMYRTLFERSMDCIYLHDLEGNFLDVNPVGLDLLEYTRAEFLSKNFISFIGKKQREKALGNRKEIIKNGYQKNVTEYHLVSKSGRSIYIETRGVLIHRKGEPYAILGIARDVTNRKITEEALRNSEEQYRFLIENATNGIIIIQDESIKFINSRMAKISGYSKKELIDHPFTDFFAPEKRDSLLKQLRKFARNEKAIKSFPYKGVNKAGETVIVQTKVVEVEWEAKPAILIFLRDVTAEKKYEARVMQTQKMEAIGTLSGGIAHDFNNILGAIVLNAEMAIDDVEEGSEVRYSLDQILTSSYRAKKLVDQILTFSREAVVERKPLEFGLIIKETLKMLRSVIPSTISINQYIPADMGMVMADPAQLQQMVVNLINNAVDAMKKKGGELEIRLESISVKEPPHGFDCKPGKYIQLKIGDTGQGILDKNFKRIFDPFFTTRKTENRTGLGLSVVHGIVTLNKGFFSIDKRKAGGTVFEIAFPKVKEKRVPSGKEKPVRRSEGEKILLVDDEPDLIDAGKRVLERLDYKVITANSGAEALTLFSENPMQFDVVITDTTMPNMTGIELSKELLNIRPDIPIIVCTGYSELISHEKAKKFGIKKYIMKPFVKRDIAETIWKVLKKNGISRKPV